MEEKLLLAEDGWLYEEEEHSVRLCLPLPKWNESFWRLSCSGITVGRLIEWEADEEEEASPWLGFATALLLVLGLEVLA